MDCMMWYSKNCVKFFLNIAAMTIHTTPANPAVRYDAADTTLSIGYICLEGCNYFSFSAFVNKVIKHLNEYQFVLIVFRSHIYCCSV